MATVSENVIAKAQMTTEEKVNGNEQKVANEVNCENGAKTAEEPTVKKVQEKMETGGKEGEDEVPKEEAKNEEVAVEVELKTGVSFPVKLDDGKQLMSVGLRKKSMLGMGMKIYGFGTYSIKISVFTIYRHCFNVDRVSLWNSRQQNHNSSTNSSLISL